MRKHATLSLAYIIRGFVIGLIDPTHVWASFGPHTATIKRHALYLNSGHGGDLVLMSLKQNTSFQFQPTQALFQ